MALIVEVKVVPQAGVAGILMDKSGMLKIQVKSPPEDGKANKELIKLLSHALDIPQAAITIIAGLTSRKKKIKLEVPLTYEQFMHKLGLEIQNKLM
jgi:uncharacterized protein